MIEKNGKDEMAAKIALLYNTTIDIEKEINDFELNKLKKNCSR